MILLPLSFISATPFSARAPVFRGFGDNKMSLVQYFKYFQTLGGLLVCRFQNEFVLTPTQAFRISKHISACHRFISLNQFKRGRYVPPACFTKSRIILTSVYYSSQCEEQLSNRLQENFLDHGLWKRKRLWILLLLSRPAEEQRIDWSCRCYLEQDEVWDVPWSLTLLVFFGRSSESGEKGSVLTTKVRDSNTYASSLSILSAEQRR